MNKEKTFSYGILVQAVSDGVKKKGLTNRCT